MVWVGDIYLEAEDSFLESGTIQFAKVEIFYSKPAILLQYVFREVHRGEYEFAGNGGEVACEGLQNNSNMPVQ